MGSLVQSTPVLFGHRLLEPSDHKSAKVGSVACEPVTMQMLLPFNKILGSLPFPSAGSLLCIRPCREHKAFATLPRIGTHISVTFSRTISVRVSGVRTPVQQSR